MIYAKSDGTNVSSLLTTASITVNNLTVTVDSKGGCKIETRGEWEGKITDLIAIATDLTGEVLEELDEQEN